MDTPNRNLPRFVPTLTEVVDPATLTGMATNAKPELEAMIELVQRQIQPIFERRLEEEFERLLRSMLAKQWSDVAARLHDEMAKLIRQAVTDELATLKASNRQNFN